MPTPSATTSSSASSTPSPSADATTGSATPTPSTSTAPSSPSANGSTAPTAAAVVGFTPSTAAASTTPSSGGAVTVAWQCATNEAKPSGISKSACIGIGSDGGLYIHGTFTASNGQAISNIKVSLAGSGQFLDTASTSCGGSSCSITGGPYKPSAGTYQAYAGIDGSAHNEASPSISYPG